MLRLALVLAVLVAMVVPALANGPVALAQCNVASGAVVQLAGTPHLFVADDQLCERINTS